MKITQTLTAVATAGALALLMSSTASAVTLNMMNGSEPGSIDANPGCHSVWLNYDGEWRIAPGATSGFGLTPADPAKLRQAAERFAKSE